MVKMMMEVVAKKEKVKKFEEGLVGRPKRVRIIPNHIRRK